MAKRLSENSRIPRGVRYCLYGVLVIFSGLATAAWRFSDFILYPHTRSPETVYDSEVERGTLSPEAFSGWEKETVTLRSPHGYELFGMYLPLEGSHKTVVILHGITANHISSVKYGALFRELGFNVLLVDHRNHGLSGGSNTTYGAYEKGDVKVWVDWVYERCGADCIVGTHGESMGAAIALLHAAIDPRPAFVVADCPYARARDEFAYRLKAQYGLPPFPLVLLADGFSRLRAGFAFRDAAPLDAIDAIDVPVLFIHGAADSYIPSEAAVTLYEAKQGVKQLYLVPGAGHASSLIQDPEGYLQALTEFLGTLGIVDE